MKIQIGKKIQSKTSGCIAKVVSGVVDGFVTLKFIDTGEEKFFADYVLQNKWTDKIDKNMKVKIEEPKTIQYTKHPSKKKNPEKDNCGFPYVMYTWVKYGRKKDALKRYITLNENQKTSLEKYFKSNDVKNKHLSFLKMVSK